MNATAAAINIGLNFLLIPAWGIVGAGVSTVVGYAALAGLGFANAQAGYPVSHDWPRVFRTAVRGRRLPAALGRGRARDRVGRDPGPDRAPGGCSRSRSSRPAS